MHRQQMQWRTHRPTPHLAPINPQQWVNNPLLDFKEYTVKRILLTAVLMCYAIVFAGEAEQSQSSASVSDAVNQGNTQSITFQSATTPADTKTSVIYSGTQTVKNVPSVNGPSLTTSNDTCMGSTSGSLNIAGLGIGGGSSWVDENCKMLKNSRELWNMGMKAASLALMCNDSANKEALELTGFVCPQTARANTVDEAKASSDAATTPLAMSSSTTAYTGTDPIVIARMARQ